MTTDLLPPIRAAHSDTPDAFPALRFDPEAYQHLMPDDGMSDEQKQVVLESLWVIVTGFVDLGFRTGPYHAIAPENSDILLGQDSGDVLSSGHAENRVNYDAAAPLEGAAGRTDS